MFWQQALWCIELAIHKRRVEDQPRLGVGDLRLPPQLHLALQRLKVPLNPINADRERVNQVEALGVWLAPAPTHLGQCLQVSTP
jgi:hypothetical protein